jgi:centractin
LLLVGGGGGVVHYNILHASDDVKTSSHTSNHKNSNYYFSSLTMEEENQPVCIDNGSGVMKAGFAGQDTPSCTFPTLVGRPKHDKLMIGGLTANTVFVGNDADENRGLLTLKYPINQGIVTNWKDMERIWESIYGKSNLNVSKIEQHPVLMTEVPLNPNRNREKSAEVFFETFNVPAFFISPQATLSLYASGRTTGVVLDVGDGVTHSVPVFEGFALRHALTRSDVGGRDVTSRLQLLLRKSGSVFHTSAEFQVVRCIKESTCYVSKNVKQDEEQLSRDEKSMIQQYTLPDGRRLNLSGERFRAPELLFDPTLIGLEYRGVHKCLVDSIHKSDLDLRKTLYEHIVLAGGSTKFKGFGNRLLDESRRLAPKGTKIRITASPDRQWAAWIGGSILASLTSFKTMWIRRDTYEEMGCSVLHRKAL